ncbi:MAG: hypothetical protein JXR68_12445 [Bacteroidales bacterium]|nr:hypothetical protein [Bacteroidales bacterium]
MKNVKFFLGALAVLAVTFFTACTESTQVAVTINPTTTTAAPGDVVSYSVTLTPDAINNGELGDFFIETADGTQLYSQSFTGGNTDTLSYDYTVPANAVVGEDITLTFRAIDGKSGVEASTNATITVEIGLPDIVSATDIQTNYVSTSLANSMMFVLGETSCTTADGNSTDGDLAFVYQNTYGYSVCSPNATWIADLYNYNGVTYNTSNKNETKIALYNGNWADLDQTTINNLTVTTSTVAGGGNGVQNLNEGDIVIFETADGRKGALLVKTNAKISMYMTADLMYQATPASAGK